jgi:hypothetical protein
MENNKDTSAKNKNIKTGILVWGLLITISYLIFGIRAQRAEFMGTSHWSNPAWNTSTLEFDVLPEIAPNISSSSITVKHGAHVHSDWSFIEDHQWFLVNPYEASDLCMPLFKTIVFDMPSKKMISLDQINVWLSSAKGSKSSIQAFIPTFNAEPKQLAECPGFSYDTMTKTLRVGKKQVALLTTLKV